MLKVETTGNLRSELASAMSAVRSGELELDNARTIVKLAAQINESLYSEMKVKQVLTDAGEETSRFGSLKLA